MMWSPCPLKEVLRAEACLRAPLYPPAHRNKTSPLFVAVVLRNYRCSRRILAVAFEVSL